MKPLALSLVFHDHQPVGNFGWVIEEAYKTAYLPLLECLERHPAVRTALHFTGPLRDWILENEPGFFARVRTLVTRGQVEVLGGAYYEPILVALDDADRLGQLVKLSRAVKEDFGKEPAGAWLAERVWEPQLPEALAQAGLGYVILDDTHFKAAGLMDDDLFGYYMTEDRGHLLKVFPTLKHLRYTIPWAELDDVMAWLRDQAEAPDMTGRYAGKQRLALMGDDGEKFGLWPTSYDRVWLKGWMDDFFTAIEEATDWLTTVTPGVFAADNPPLGRIYLPTNSYDEMGEWSMPADAGYELPALKRTLTRQGRTDVVAYMRGGLWRNFMVKYDEVNQLHKKSLWVSRKVHAMIEGPAKEKALDHLWAGQCNCGYWHGSFGGIYLFHIREINYRNLITAEVMADEAAGKTSTSLTQVDFDLDGLDDLVMESPHQVLVIDPDQGGSLVEWEYRPAKINFVNVMTRRREAYHRVLEEGVNEGRIYTPEEAGSLHEHEREMAVIVSEHGLEKHLAFDWHRRAMAVDHFLRAGTTLEDYAQATYGEQGDFANQPYRTAIVGDEALLWREGGVWSGDDLIPVKVEKSFRIQDDDTLVLAGRVINHAEGDLTATYGVELSWGLAGGQSPEGATLLAEGEEVPFGEKGQLEDVKTLTVTSRLWRVEVAVEISEAALMWLFPLETISNSGSAYERTYQGTSMLLSWPLWLAPGESWSYEIVFRMKSL